MRSQITAPPAAFGHPAAGSHAAWGLSLSNRFVHLCLDLPPGGPDDPQTLGYRSDGRLSASQ